MKITIDVTYRQDKLVVWRCTGCDHMGFDSRDHCCYCVLPKEAGKPDGCLFRGFTGEWVKVKEIKNRHKEAVEHFKNWVKASLTGKDAPFDSELVDLLAQDEQLQIIDEVINELKEVR